MPDDRHSSSRVTSSALPHTFRQLADFAEIRGSSREAADWRHLAEDIEQSGTAALDRLEVLARHEHPSALTSVGAPLHASLRDVLSGEPDSTVRAARMRLPQLFRTLLDYSTLDSQGAVALAGEGIVTLDDLALGLHDDRIASQLPQYSLRLLQAEAMLQSERPRITLGRAFEVLDNLMVLLAAACPNLDRLIPAGDVRRVEPVVESLVVVGQTADPQRAIGTIAEISRLLVRHRAARRVVADYQGLEIDIRIVAADEFGTALFTTTGSRDHLLAMRARQGTPPLASREEEVYAHAGLSWVPPELRLGAGEIEAAGKGTLPKLVTREDIRGDLHTHSVYSDGRDSVEDMVQMAAALGYEYIAITDHSERAGAAKTVTADALKRQRDEIDALRDRFPTLTILHGAEVDIMPNGTLDFPDDVLASLDIVLASLHDSHGHDPARLTRRCLMAIAHPLVNVITHPANRLVGRDGGYALDFAAIYAAAAETGTALEIDGAPGHLDLDGDHAREAVAAGVTVTIDSDCHKARLLDRQMRLGVGTARRGWVETRHVLNTRPLEEVQAFLRQKREGSS